MYCGQPFKPFKSGSQTKSKWWLLVFILHLSSVQLVWSRYDCNSHPHLMVRLRQSLQSQSPLQGAIGDKATVTSCSHHFKVTCFTLESICLHNMLKWFLWIFSDEETADEDCHQRQEGDHFHQDSSHPCWQLSEHCAVLQFHYVCLSPHRQCMTSADINNLHLSWSLTNKSFASHTCTLSPILSLSHTFSQNRFLHQSRFVKNEGYLCTGSMAAARSTSDFLRKTSGNHLHMCTIYPPINSTGQLWRFNVDSSKVVMKIITFLYYISLLPGCWNQYRNPNMNNKDHLASWVRNWCQKCNQCLKCQVSCQKSLGLLFEDVL